MLEIEQKYAGADFDHIERWLAAQEAVGPEVHVEADHYFNAPDRDFARTGEAFRLRRIGSRNFLTFKGPRRQAAIRIRTELEIPLPDGDEAARQHIELLQMLGYRPVAVVRKQRISHTLTRDGLTVTVCLDDVADVGRFAEVEVLAGDDQVEQAGATLAALADALHLQVVEQRSYLTMLLQRQAEQEQTRREVRIVATRQDLRQVLMESRRKGQTVGLVPTMGALHEGHLSLIRAARSRNDLVVVSVFVNPTQFGPNEDLTRYPRPFEDDVRQCAAAGVDLVFHPPVEELYPPGFGTWVEVEGLQDRLEGAARPGHFRGVATVVLKLFHLVQPDRAYFGQKDAQQARLIQNMVRDLDVPVEVVVCPILREADGLALSSRNRYLDNEQRRNAAALHQALQAACERHRAGERDGSVLRRLVEDRIRATPGAVLDHAAVVDPVTFLPVERLAGPALLVLAARFGATRLIDNLRLED